MADFPTTGDDVIFGTSAGEEIDALAGDDTIFGAGGNDTLRGNSGDDQLSGGLGLDILIGGRGGSDTAYYALAFDGVFASLELGYGYVGFGNKAVDKDTYNNIENIEGGLGGDNLAGNEYANTLKGNGGDDTISGNAGNDIVTGGAGADTLDGGAGIDMLNYSTSRTGVIVNFENNHFALGDAEGDTVSGFENVTGGRGDDHLIGWSKNNVSGDNVFIGNGGRDNLLGGAGDDELRGGSGDDVFWGGSGFDIMDGGPGKDWMREGEFYVFGRLSHSGVGKGQRDIIQYFDLSNDIIDLRGIDANPTTPEDDAFTFIGAAEFTGGTAGQLRFIDDEGSVMVIELRADASGGADMQIELRGIYEGVPTGLNFLL